MVYIFIIIFYYNLLKTVDDNNNCNFSVPTITCSYYLSNFYQICIILHYSLQFTGYYQQQSKIVILRSELYEQNVNSLSNGVQTS